MHRPFHNKLHHAPRPQTQKNPPGGNFFPPNIFSQILVAQFGLPICGPSVLMQRIAERLTSPIAGLGGYSKDHVFFYPKKCAGTSAEQLVHHLKD